MIKNVIIGVLFVALIIVVWWSYTEINIQSVVTPDSQPEMVAEYKDLVKVTTPLPGERITNPLKISGEARGGWFFEASFPVVLTDWDGRIIAEGFATAHEDWMTSNFVPFTAMLTFIKPEYGDRGTLILQKNNPSGLPEHDDAFEYTVRY